MGRDSELGTFFSFPNKNSKQDILLWKSTAELLVFTFCNFRSVYYTGSVVL